MGLYRRKGCDVWWMSFTVEGRQKQQSTGTVDRKSAEKIFMKTKTRVNEERFLEYEQLARLKFSDMIRRFEAEFTERKPEKQKKRDKSIFKHFKAFFGEDVTLKHVANNVGSYEPWRAVQLTHLGRNPDSGTIRKELLLLGTMFNAGRRNWKWKISNPVSDIILPEESKQRTRYLSIDEFKALFAQLDVAPEPWLKPIVNSAIGTGLRQDNLIELRKNEVNLDDEMLFIDAEKMKNNDYLGSPLSGVALETIRGRVKSDTSDSPYVFNDNGKQLYDRKVQRAFNRAVKASGIKDFRFHDLRHCFASYLRQNGVELDIIAKLMGHKDLRMTKRYAHLNVENLREPMKKLDKALLRFYDSAEKEKRVA